MTVRKCVVALLWICYIERPHLCMTWMQMWQKCMPTSFVLGQVPEMSRSTEERREEQTKKCPSDYIPLVMSSKCLLHIVLRFWASVLNFWLSLYLYLSSVWPPFQYCTCKFFYPGKGFSHNCHGGRASTHNLASMGACAAGSGFISPLFMSVMQFHHIHWHITGDLLKWLLY